MSTISKPVPPGTPPPSPPPGGPRHPEPTGPPPRDDATGPRPDTTRPVPTPRPAPGPGRGVAALVADSGRHGAAWLHLLTTAADDGEFDEATRRQLNAAANHAACALNRLANIKLPARSVPTTTPPGGMGSTPARCGPAGAAVAPAVAGKVSGPVLPPVEASTGAPNPPAGSEGGRAGDGAAAVPGAVRDFSTPTPPPQK